MSVMAILRQSVAGLPSCSYAAFNYLEATDTPDSHGPASHAAMQAELGC
jgi:hypothetical protein